ncbi:MAG: tetratricopeptide repeat protein, partial [Salibacteraceae bacterium]
YINTSILIIKGLIANKSNKPGEAFKYYFKALEGLDTSKYIELTSDCYHRIANLYQELDDYIEAEIYFTKALKTSARIDSVSYYEILNDYAILKAQIDQEDSAEYYLTEISNYFFEHDQNSIQYINSLANLGILKEWNGYYSESRSIYKKALTYYRRQNDEMGIVQFMNNLGGNYLEDHKYDSAEYFLLNSYIMSDSLSLLENAHSASMNLADLYERKEDYKNALKWSHIESDLKDSLTSAEVLIEIGSLNKEFENKIAEDRRQRKLEEEQAKAERQANIQFFGIFLGIIFFFLVVFMAAKFSLPEWLANGIVFFAFVLLFEFVLVVLDPFIDSVSDGKPLIKLGCNVLLALFIIPLHSLFEKRLRRFLTT